MHHLRDILTKNLMWSEAIRALCCMLPMLIAVAIHKTTFIVALGQGGFFFSSLLLPKRIRGRALMGSVLTALGLGFYLIGGNVAPIAFLAVIMTFFVSMNLSYLTSWKIGGPLALSIIMIYTAGLNTGSPEKAAANYLAFVLVLAWSALISLLPIWEPIEPPRPAAELKYAELTEQGMRMGIGTSIALSAAYIFDFAKLGWAVSAVGSVVRYDLDTSKKRAWARFAGTLGGSLIAAFLLVQLSSVAILVIIGALFAALNGLYKKSVLGQIPLFYTATILLLYSLNDISQGKQLAIYRFAYNLVGILVAILVVYYPFPLLSRHLKAVADERVD
jgi:hypothetical protein